MPIGVLSRLSNSLSQGGNCVTNLRGFVQSELAGEPLDYIKPTRRFSFDGALSSISTEPEDGPWANTIQRAFYSTDSEGSAELRYGDFPISQSTSGTILFRMYIQTWNDPLLIPAVQTVFQNGTSGVDGYGIKLTFAEVGVESFEWNLYFCRLTDSLQTAWIKLNTSGPLVENTWYQFSVRFVRRTINNPRPTLVSTVVAYQNGSFQVDQNLASLIIAPGDTEAPFWLGFYGRLTDMALLNVPLTDAQLAAYGTAPYI
jgi:hypothetical protein